MGDDRTNHEQQGDQPKLADELAIEDLEPAAGETEGVKGGVSLNYAQIHWQYQEQTAGSVP